jgi:hypothetical protein
VQYDSGFNPGQREKTHDVTVNNRIQNRQVCSESKGCQEQTKPIENFSDVITQSLYIRHRLRAMLQREWAIAINRFVAWARDDVCLSANIPDNNPRTGLRM